MNPARAACALAAKHQSLVYCGHKVVFLLYETVPALHFGTMRHDLLVDVELHITNIQTRFVVFDSVRLHLGDSVLDTA